MMFKADVGWWLPHGEEHLQSWMMATGDVLDGRFLYQGSKYRAVLDYARERRLALDIGGHVGLWSWVMAHDFDKVIAFEPEPEHVACFIKNTAEPLRGEIDLHAVALSDETTMVSLSRASRDSSGSNAVDPVGAKRRPGAMLIPACRLDDFEIAGPVDLLKIDTEGYELKVLRGGERTIRRDRPAIIVEQRPETNMFHRYGHRLGDAVALLESWGAKLRGEMIGDFILSWDP
jgi:FkbM family methyltransferase